MRLIDADELIKGMMYDYVHGTKNTYEKNGIACAKLILENQPTVDAIPVLWIAEWVTTHDEFSWSRMLHDWKAERKEE